MMAYTSNNGWVSNEYFLDLNSEHELMVVEQM